MTTVINLFGGPGTGKSTSAAYLFSQLKMRGHSAELVAEYAKTWAWQDRKIGDFDQFYLFGKQTHHESRLFGKVDWIVTDSPVLLCSVYARRYNTAEIADAMAEVVQAYYRRAEELEHKHVDVRLQRSKPFDSRGRYENEEQAREIDTAIAARTRTAIECGTDAASLDALLDKLLKQ